MNARNAVLVRAMVPALLAVLAVVPPVLAMPRGKVELKDGRVWDPVDYEVKGNRLYVKFVNTGAETDISMDEVKKMISTGDAPPAAGEAGDAAAAEAAEAPSARDWEGRFELEPPEGWQVAAPSSPLARAQLRHGERNATFVVYLRPVDGDWALEPGMKNLPRELTDGISQDLTSRYARVTVGRTQVWTLFDSPVLRTDGISATPFGDKASYKVTEVRFRRGGFEYALTYTVAPADEGALATTVDRLFESFTFLPTVATTPELYADLGRGFALTRPNADWQLLAAPFEVEAPLRMITDKGRAELTVTTQAGTDAEAVVQAMIRARKQRSPHCGKDTVEKAELRGTPIARFQFEDFRAEDKKNIGCRGFAAAVGGGRVVLFMGVAALTDEDVRKIQGDLDTTLAGVRLKDDERMRAVLGQARDGMLLIKQGVDAQAAKHAPEAIALFDQAVTLFPTFARAFYLRALAKRDAQDFPGFRADAERAAELEPGAGYDADLAASQEQEADAAEKKKEYLDALKLWVRLFRRSHAEPHRRHIATCAGALWSASKTAKEPAQGLQVIERELQSLRSEPAIAAILISTYRDGATVLARDGEFGAAKRWLGKIPRLTTDQRIRDDAEKQIQQINQQQQRAPR